MQTNSENSHQSVCCVMVILPLPSASNQAPECISAQEPKALRTTTGNLSIKNIVQGIHSKTLQLRDYIAKQNPFFSQLKQILRQAKDLC